MAVGGAVGGSTGVDTKATAGVAVAVGVGLEGNLRGDAEVSSHAHKRMDSPAHKGSSDVRMRGFKSHGTADRVVIHLLGHGGINLYVLAHSYCCINPGLHDWEVATRCNNPGWCQRSDTAHRSRALVYSQEHLRGQESG